MSLDSPSTLLAAALVSHDINFVVGLTWAIVTFVTKQEDHRSLVGLARMAPLIADFF